MRKMIFNKYGATDKPWIISDAQVHLFDVDESKAKSLADEWQNQSDRDEEDDNDSN